MSYLHKALEKILLWRIEETTLKDKPLHYDQHGFRPGFSCDSALTGVVGQVEYTIQQRSQGLGIFCDLEGAFNAVSYEAIINGLNKRKFDPLFIEWYKYYLYNRFFTIDLKGQKLTKTCSRGVPQGGVLSPLAFGIATEDVLNLFDEDKPDPSLKEDIAGNTPDSNESPAELHATPILARRNTKRRQPKNKKTKAKTVRKTKNTPKPAVRTTVTTTAFADDLCFYISGGTTKDLQKKAQYVMDKAAAWSHTKGMRFSSSKTETIIFSRVKYKKPKSIILNGTPLEYTKLVKYLGVYIDSKLYWNDHVDIKIKKAKKAMMACVRVCHPKSGVPPLCASYYWKSCILPMFTYGCLVWHPACRKITIQKKLKSFQRLALKMMGPLRRSTPTRGLEIINYIRPIELETRKIAAEAYLRTIGQEKIHASRMKTNKITQIGHRQWCYDFLKSIGFPYLDQQFDDRIRKWIWKKRYDVEFDNTIPGSKNYGRPADGLDLHIYTDGSLIKDPHNPLNTEAGSGLSIDRGQEIQYNKLGQGISIFQAEMYSIKRSAAWFLKNQSAIKGKNIAIYTDSLASLKALHKPVTRSKLVVNTADMLNAVATKCSTLSLRWVKAHWNNTYNDQADAAAVAAARSIGPIVQDRPLVSIATAKTYIRYSVDKLWGQLFRELRKPDECRQTKLWFPRVMKSRSLRILKCNRLQWGKLMQLMTGHNYLNRHNWVIDPDLVPDCDICDHGYIQDSQHLMAECPLFIEQRLNLFNHRVISPPFNDLPISKVLTFLLHIGTTALSWI